MIDMKDIQEIFKDYLDMIESDTVKDAVITAWLLGCERGGWKSMDELKNMPFTLLTDCKGVSFIEHCLPFGKQTRSLTSLGQNISRVSAV